MYSRSPLLEFKSSNNATMSVYCGLHRSLTSLLDLSWLPAPLWDSGAEVHPWAFILLQSRLLPKPRLPASVLPPSSEGDPAELSAPLLLSQVVRAPCLLSPSHSWLTLRSGLTHPDSCPQGPRCLLLSPTGGWLTSHRYIGLFPACDSVVS